MSDSGQPGEGPANPFAANPSPIPLRQPQGQATRLSAWGAFSQFMLGIGLGSLPLTVIFLANNLTAALVLYAALIVLSLVLMVSETYRFVGFGMLAAILADPVIVVQSCFVSIGGPQGGQPPAPPLHASHSVSTISHAFRHDQA